MFAFVFNIVKKFLDEYTLSKIHIYKQESNKWLPELLAQVDKSQIPQYFGGTMTDPDGSPKCMTKVSWMFWIYCIETKNVLSIEVYVCFIKSFEI